MTKQKLKPFNTYYYQIQCIKINSKKLYSGSQKPVH